MAALNLPRLLGCAAALAGVPALRAAEPVNQDAAAEQRTLESWGFHQPEPIDFSDHAGYQPITDGKTLAGWDGDTKIWKVVDGAIVGEADQALPFNHSYLVYRGARPHDFDLKLELKVERGGGSGIQYRSQTGVPWRGVKPTDRPQPNLDWMMTGPQADFWFPVSPICTIFSGQFYSENTGLGIIAWRGQVVVSGPGAKPRLVGTIADRAALGGYIRENGWNEYLVMARGGTFIHVINGQLMAVYVDDDPRSSSNQSGFIGIELEGAPTRVSFRHAWLKPLN